MATITSANGNSFLNSPRRTYIASREFSGDFYQIVGPDDNGLYTLGGVTGADAGNCPVGRVLRENGKKIYPNQYKGIVYYLVGVYDEQSFLKGFINPNSPCFAVLNTDMPTYLTSINGNGEAADNDGGLPNRGNSVYTRGDVIADGKLVVNDLLGEGSTVGGDLAVGGDLDVSGSIYVHQPLVLPSAVVVPLSTNTTTTYNFLSTPSAYYKFRAINTVNGQTQTLASSASPLLPANSQFNIQVANSGVTTGISTLIAFGTNFNVATTPVLLLNTQAITLGFVSNGSSYSEIYRSGTVTQF